MQKFDQLTGVAAPLPMMNVDTDMIIPKQFLKTIKRTGLGKNLFDEMRYTLDGKEIPDFVLNKPQYRKATILVAGPNFGCGSSREHAPWALVDAGFRAVISTSIADIFLANALKNGLVPVRVDEPSHAWLLAHPGVEVEIDVAGGKLLLPGGHESAFELDPFARHCLVRGVDELGYLLSRLPDIENWENSRAG